MSACTHPPVMDGMCSTCWLAERRPAKRAWHRVDNITWLLEQGESVRSAARRLGIKPGSVQRAIYRATGEWRTTA